MDLKETFIMNLRKFRKIRGVSQMTLAALSDTSGNYISAIELGRRIPSFEMIDRIASALHIASWQLFLEETDERNRVFETKEYLIEIPQQVKKEIADHILALMQQNIMESLNPKNY